MGMTVMALSPSQSYGGAGHAFPVPLAPSSLLRFLHSQLLNGSVQTLMARWVFAPAVPQKPTVTVQIIIRAPPTCRPAAVTPTRLVSGVSALAAFSGLAPSGGARLMPRVVSSPVLSSTAVSPSSFTAVVSSTSRAIVLSFRWRLQGM